MAVKASWDGDKKKKSVWGASLNAAEKILLYAEGLAKKNASGRPGPNVISGRMRSSLTHMITNVSADSITGKFGTNVDYAPPVEYGTFKSRAFPFMRPAADQTQAKIPSIYEAELKKVL